MNKQSLTADEKERLKREEMERLRNNFLKIRPDNDKALEDNLRRQSPVPLSPRDLVSKQTTDTIQEPANLLESQVDDLPAKDQKQQEAGATAGQGIEEDTAVTVKSRFPTANVASPTTAVLFKELAPQIKALRITEPARRITVSVSEEVFSRVSHLHFVERVGKLEIMSFLMERFVPKDRPEKLPRFLVRELEEEDQPRHLVFFEDLKLAERLDWLKAKHGFSKVTVVKNIVLHVLPPAPFNVPPTKRRRAGLTR